MNHLNVDISESEIRGGFGEFKFNESRFTNDQLGRVELIAMVGGVVSGGGLGGVKID